MPNEVVINGLTGTSPFYVYLCDTAQTTCVYIDSITSVPYSFEIPELFDGQTEFDLKIVTSNGCEIIQNISS
jgi:hypothetical protein